MAIYLRPDGIAVNTWLVSGAADLPTALNEGTATTGTSPTTANDASFGYSGNNPNGSGIELTLSDPSGLLQAGTLSVNFRRAQLKDAVLNGTGTAVTMDVTLKDAAGLTLATKAGIALTGAWVADSLTYAVPAGADASGWTVRVACSGGSGNTTNRRGGGVSWLDVTAPDVLVSSAPAAPSGLTASSVAAPVLGWTDNATAELGYYVHRSETTGYTPAVGTRISADLGANATAYTDVSADGSKTYYYIVEAWNAAGSSYSAQASATTPAGTTYPGIDTIVDDFNDGVLDTANWAGTPDRVSESGGGLRISLPASTVSFAAYEKKGYQTLVGKRLVVKVDASEYAPGVAGVGLQSWTRIYSGSNSSSWVRIEVTSSGTGLRLQVRWRVSGSAAVIESTIAYSPSNHSHLSIRETAGTVYCEAGSTASGPWTLLASVLNSTLGFDLSYIRLDFAANQYAAIATPGVAIWDAINPPAAAGATLGGKPVKRWNGTAWVDPVIQRWDGTALVPVT